MKEGMVLYTLPFTGYLMPLVALAKLFVNHGFSVTVVTFNHPLGPGKVDEDVSRLSLANPTIGFHVLPPVALGVDYSKLVPPALTRAILIAQNTNFHNFLQDLSNTISVRAIVLDLFCTVAHAQANQLSIPVYLFTPFGASCTALFLHLLELNASTNLSLKDFGENPTNFVGLPSVPASDFPDLLLDHESYSYKSFMQTLSDVVKSDGIFMNTFESLEPKAISVLREGLCSPSFHMPPIYCIGPLITESRETGTHDRHECLKWLGSQPKNIVVFLCFGSMGGFTQDQIRQIAIGLENSGQRFLWVVKVTKMFNNLTPEFELDQILPEGFLDRTKDRGMVVKSWAPQVQVLHHESIGGFVTHCGWNSIQEAVTAGKPMICWPLYAEQRLNKAVLADHETRLGVAIEGYDKDMVEAGEVEAKVRWLMESENGKLLKEHIEVMKDKAAESLTESGPSSKAFMQFLMDLEGRIIEKTKIQ